MSIRDEVRDAPAYVFRAWPHRVKLDQNEAPADLAEPLRERVLDRLREVDWHRYPELRAHTVAAAIAERDGWDPDGVVVAPGSNVLIQALVIAAGLGRRVLTVSPTFAVYASQARLLGVELSEVPLSPDGFALDAPALTRELRRGPGVVFLADPAAPTGNRLDDDAVAAVLEAASRHDWTVVIDEAYWPYAGVHRLDEIRGRPDRVALRTFSKADALGGVRLGYALAHPDTAKQVGKVLLPFDVSALQAAVAEVVLADDEAAAARERRIATARRERERVREALAAHPEVTVYPSVTNFLLFRVPDAEAAHRAFLDEGVLVRRQDHLPGLGGCLRVTVGSEADDDAFLAAAERALTARRRSDPSEAPSEAAPSEAARG
ncbi:MAG: histidinol-phosphate transaminase [Trueperaceae bacterium]|nr:histidinol-phosphate transaminase [Trueperaceae bacterium]